VNHSQQQQNIVSATRLRLSELMLQVDGTHRFTAVICIDELGSAFLIFTN
jgi:hypothetical protein